MIVAALECHIYTNTNKKHLNLHGSESYIVIHKNSKNKYRINWIQCYQTFEV